MKNTFLTVIDVPAPSEMQRSCSDSDLSSSRKSGRAHLCDLELSGSAGEVGSCSSSEAIDSSVDPRASRLLMTNPQMWSGDASDSDGDAPARSADAGLPSKGSALHSSGRCKPCLYYLNRKDKCLLGAECGFCHEYHKKKRSRPKRAGQDQGGAAESSGGPLEAPGGASSGDPVAAIIYGDQGGSAASQGASARGSGAALASAAASWGVAVAGSGTRRAAASALVYGAQAPHDDGPAASGSARPPGGGRRLIMRL